MKAVCNNGHVFNFTMPVYGAQIDNGIFRNIKTNCPICNAPAKVQDGIYNLSGTGQDQLIKSFDQKDLVKIEEIARINFANNRTRAEFRDELVKALPNKVSIIDRILELSTNENFRFWMMAFLTLVVGLITGGITYQPPNTTPSGEPDMTFSQRFAYQQRIKNLEKENSKLRKKKNKR